MIRYINWFIIIKPDAL